MTRMLTTIAGIVSLAVSLHAQSLADAARKAEEKRGAPAAQTGKTKVYTKKDVDALPPEIVTTSSREPKTGASTLASSEPESTDDAAAAKDEAYWKRRMAPLQAQLDHDRLMLTAAKSALRNLEVYMVPSQWNWMVYGRDWQRLTSEVSTWEAAVRDDEKRVAALEDEARVAGALPGWLR